MSQREIKQAPQKGLEVLTIVIPAVGSDQVINDFGVHEKTSLTAEEQSHAVPRFILFFWDYYWLEGDETPHQ